MQVEVALRSAPPLMRCVDDLEVWLACLFSRLELEIQTNFTATLFANIEAIPLLKSTYSLFASNNASSKGKEGCYRIRQNN